MLIKTEYTASLEILSVSHLSETCLEKGRQIEHIKKLNDITFAVFK